jgi:hypothetical protein
MAKDPRLTAIEAEADRRSRDPNSRGGAKSSHKERFAIRAQLRQESGLGKEQKKRGGIAGVYDANKQWAVPLGLGILGAVTGGAAIPALAGAGIGGLDREGQGGIGFDVGGAARGGVQGLAAGSLGNLAGGALGVGQGAAGTAASAPLAVGSAEASAPWLSGAAPTAGGATIASPIGMIPASTTTHAGSAVGAAMPASGASGSFLGRAGDWLTGNGGRNALGALQTVNAAYQGAQARAMANRAVRGQEAEWKANEPLRIEGRRRLLAGVPGNPFAAPLGVSNDGGY